jgi:hypothetical protein
MKPVLLLMLMGVIGILSFKPVASRFDGVYGCDSRLAIEELKISGDRFLLAHHSHLDGQYTRQGRISITGDTIQLIEEKNTITNPKDLMPFHSRLLLKNDHLYVLFKNKKNKEYIRKSLFNYAREESEYLLQQDWVKE